MVKKQTLMRQQRFLKAFAKCGTIRRAAPKAKVNRETVRQWRLNDPAFEKKFQEVDQDVTGMLEDSAVEDALRGDTVTRIFLLKARRPEIYRDNTKLSGQLGKDGEVTTFTLTLGDGASA